MWCEAFAIGVAFGVKLFVMFENDTIGNCVSKHVLSFLWVQQLFSIVLIRFHVCLIRFPLALTMTSCVWNCSCMIFVRFSLCFIGFLMILRCFEVFGCVFEVFWGVWRCAQVSDLYSFSYVSIDLRCRDPVWALYNTKKEVGCAPPPSIPPHLPSASSSVVLGARAPNGVLVLSSSIVPGARSPNGMFNWNTMHLTIVKRDWVVPKHLADCAESTENI